MLLALSLDAHALPAPTCPVLEYVGSVPSDYARGLPAETVVTLVFDDGAGCGDPELVVGLHGADVGPVDATLVDEGRGVFRIVPRAPLRDDDYVADVTTPFLSFGVHFEVGGRAGTGIAPPAEGVTLSADRRCDELLTTWVRADATFGEVRGGGLLRCRVATEDGEVATVTAPYDADPHVAFETEVLGGRELCVALALEDVTGATAWELEPVCAEEFAGCEFEGLQIGSGCSTAPGGPGLALLAVLATRAGGGRGGRPRGPRALRQPRSWCSRTSRPA